MWGETDGSELHLGAGGYGTGSYLGFEGRTEVARMFLTCTDGSVLTASSELGEICSLRKKIRSGVL